MARHILGLDMGKSSVKAVLIEASLRGGARIVAWETIDIAEAGGVREALRRIQEIPVLTVPACQTALAAGNFSFRNLKLPFKDRKKISQTLPFELESQIPGAMDSMVVDFTSLARIDGADLFTAIIPKTDVEERVKLLAEYGFDAEVIDIDAVPVAARLMTDTAKGELYLLLDVGSSETTAVFFRGETILQVRSFAFGGNDITQALSGAIGIPFAEAEARKRRGDTGPAAEEIAGACRKFFASLKNTLQALQVAGLAGDDLAAIHLTGGGALCGRFAAEASRYFAVPVERVNVTALAGMRPLGGEEAGWDSLIMNGALALALRPLSKGPGFNFRRDGSRRRREAFRFQPGFNPRWAALAATVILMLACADLFVSYQADRTKLEQLKTETASILQQTFPEVTRVVDPVQQLRSKIAEARHLAAAARNMSSSGAALAVMKDLSERVPESSGFIVTSLVMEGDKIDIRGEASGFNAAETIKKGLEKSGRYEQISVSSSTVRKNNRLEFELKTVLAKKP